MNFEELIEKVRNIPYGRNSNRHDFSLVISENKGTCSSKHAFLKEYAEHNNITNVKLCIGIFKMSEDNTSKIFPLLTNNKISYIPEAHCYLKMNNQVIDVTSSTSFYEKIKEDIIQEIEIEPYQVIEYKVKYHKDFIKKWLKNNSLPLTIDKIWDIREQCICKLEENEI